MNTSYTPDSYDHGLHILQYLLGSILTVGCFGILPMFMQWGM